MSRQLVRAVLAISAHSRSLHRSYHASASLEAPSALFSAAGQAVQKLSASPSNEDKLSLYALFKQATVGKNTTSKPGMFDIVGKAKWQAWSDVSALSSEEAEKQYIDLCRRLGATFNESGPVASATPAAASSAPASKPAEGLLVKTEGRVRTITLNRPDKRNAITFAMYHDICVALDDAAADPSISVTVLTGAGAFFCSGNDLSNFANIPKGGPQELAEQGRVTLQKYVGKFITFPKYLVAALNGPAVGIAVTTLPLFDAVYASHKATLHAPLTALGQSPEGASSFTFPRAIGVARANDILLLGRKISAQEGKEWGLVNEVFDDGSFQTEVAERVKAAASLPPQALTLSKKIMRERDIPAMEAANEAECKLIKERWLSEECMSAIMAFLSKASKK